MRLFLGLITLILSTASFAQIDFKAHITVNGKEHGMIMPGAPAVVEMYFEDPRSGEIYKDFKIMHGKLMHMVLIKEDLSVFQHIHPYFEPVTGRFQLVLNVPYADPDNFMAPQALTKPGMYMGMVDVEIKGVGMRMAHFMVHVMGENQQRPVVLDQISFDDKIIRTVMSKDQAPNESPKYMTLLSYKTTSGCMANLNEFSLEIFKRNENDEYHPVKSDEIQPWLGQGGHAIWVSEKGFGHHKMAMAHMHSGMPESGNTLKFNFFDKEILEPGVQRAWFQFKHDGEVFTLPFTFNYFPPALTSDNC